MARIGFELIEYMIHKYSNGEIIIINESEEETPDEEMVKDVLSIMNVFVAKINGMRKNKSQKTIKKNNQKNNQKKQSKKTIKKKKSKKKKKKK